MNRFPWWAQTAFWSFSLAVVIGLAIALGMLAVKGFDAMIVFVESYFIALLGAFTLVLFPLLAWRRRTSPERESS